MKLTIPNPCSQHWEDMRHSGDGRYCNSCEKTVVDFTRLSDLEISKLLAAHTGKICGRLSVAQTGRLISPALLAPARNLWIPKLLLGSALALGFTPAQERLFPEGNLPKQQEGRESGAEKPHAGMNHQEKPKYITGTVTDQHGISMPGAYIYILGHETYRAHSDSSGNFKLEVPKELEKEKFTLFITAMGSGEVKIQVKAKQKQLPKPVALYTPGELLGEVMVNP